MQRKISRVVQADDTQRAVDFVQNSLPGMTVSFSGSGAGTLYFDISLNGQAIGTLNIDRQFITDSIWQPNDLLGS